ncbi:MAG TPA: anthranilate phosphoribosyltransferase [Flavobacteriaceae bacterium]|nr:anthranilate phosphoribosyltransferase [Flavobacteriaceae bacterium]MCB9214181.1 anthranilate phosphoribosyltransferase [Alteromonas sp.]HPF12574.1 anthranilate phosphoribosyltransferase [Flavobacteriaceae bacterium]HQU21186.1 anthranilate phosphoribosyltransferase [Flavobacteriaceae bacterium]HQU65386.1 anthranilate phosphoribosyltransferase [Flavobacteriaceae bacterium]
MKEILNRLINHEQLTKEEAKNVLVKISRGHFNPSEIAAFMTVFMMRSVSLEELEGFRDALLELCVRVPFEEYNTIDLCGTGGDAKNTFNISTLASFVTAGAGVLVSKHGNYGVSSTSGSSNVMEALGIKFSKDVDFLKRCLDEAGICVMHAPLFHPAMKHVAPIRKELGVKTFFNMLGPMVNPAFPKNQLVGVFSLELARMYGYLYQKGTKNFAVVHALDGYDEISLTGPSKIISRNAERMLQPFDLGIRQILPEAIYGGNTVETAAEIFMNILKGNGTVAQNNVVCVNAGLAVATAQNCSLEEGFTKAETSLNEGSALKTFQKLQKLSRV